LGLPGRLLQRYHYVVLCNESGVLVAHKRSMPIFSIDYFQSAGDPGIKRQF